MAEEGKTKPIPVLFDINRYENLVPEQMLLYVQSVDALRGALKVLL